MRAPSNPEPGIFQRVASRVLDAVYPPICAVCNLALKDGRSLCHSCDDDLPRVAEPFCECCGEVFQGLIDGPFSCPNCSNLKFSFAFARPAMLRDERTLDLIHRLKYGREIHLARELGRLAAEAFIDPRLEPALEGSWPLVPVPLHRRRLRNRHFNQAGEISHSLSEVIGLPIVDALKRVRETDTQTLLSRKQRMENLRGAFEVTRHGQRWIERESDGVVLVDDVLTTGSTVNECSKTLKRAGVKSVFVVTVMRG